MAAEPYAVADKALTMLLDRWAATRERLSLPEDFAPKVRRSDAGTWRFYGCGEWGCAMPTNDSGVTLKITSDPHEALAMHVIEHDGPFDGFARVHGITALTLPRRRKPVYAIWRDSVSDPGLEDYARGSAAPLVDRLTAYFRSWDEYGSDAADCLEDMADDGLSPERIARMVRAGGPKHSAERDVNDRIHEMRELAAVIIEKGGLARDIATGLLRMLDLGAVPLDLHMGNMGFSEEAENPIVFDLRVWPIGDSLDHLRMTVAW